MDNTLQAATHVSTITTTNTQPPAYIYPPNTPEQPGLYPSTGPYELQEKQVTNVVITQQPTVVTVESAGNAGSGAYTLALLLTLCGTVCCQWCLFCSIPAMIYASMANSARDPEIANNNKNISFALSTAGIVFGVVGFIVIVGSIVGYVLL